MDKILKIFLFLTMGLLLGACKSNLIEPINDGAKKTKVSLQIEYPEKFSFDKDTIQVKILNRHTKEEVQLFTKDRNPLEVALVAGIYNIKISNTNQEKEPYSGSKNDISVFGENLDLKIRTYMSYISKDWMFSELHYTANETPHGLPYFQDGYIELYNNSDETQYADGLCFSRAYMLTNEDYNIWKEHKGVIVPFYILEVPGSGSDHPVPPGGKLLIAISGINHNQENPASRYDLSKADFEMYSENSLSGIDNPNVENMNLEYIEIDYCPMLLSGCEAYYIFRPPNKQSLKDYLSTKKVKERENNGEFVYSYGIPEKDIIDAVHCAEADNKINQYIFPPYIDSGFTFCTLGLYNCVSKRKVLRMEGGRAILQDTNNSTEDFLRNQKSSYLIP